MPIGRSRSLLSAVATLAVLVAGSAFAQEVEVPQPSLAAKLEQRVGITDFKVEYSSPAVRGRQVFGGLVPFDQPWRAGANAATKLTASRDFKFGGKAIPAGSYALYAIPGKASWTVVLNSSSEQWGSAGFDTKKDVARITVKPQALTNARERMTFFFNDTTDDATSLDLEGEKTRVSAPIKVDTKSLVMANIEKATAEAWRPHFVSARYLLENGGDMKKALEYADTSIAIKPTWWNNWIRAQVLAKQGNAKDAVEAANKATELGKGDRVFEGFFKGDVEKAIADWKKKA